MNRNIKNRKVVIRITESQFKRLSKAIIDEETSKSDFMRKLLDEKLEKFVVSKHISKKR
jgi:hypothetical protein